MRVLWDISWDGREKERKGGHGSEGSVRVRIQSIGSVMVT